MPRRRLGSRALAYLSWVRRARFPSGRRSSAPSSGLSSPLESTWWSHRRSPTSRGRDAPNPSFSNPEMFQQHFPKILTGKEGRRSPLHSVKGISSLGAHSSPNSSFLRKICQDAYPLCPCLLPRNEGFFLVPNKSDWWDRECHTQHGASHTHTQTIGGVRWDETTSGVTCNQKPRHTPHTTVASRRGTVQFCGAEIGGLDSHLASTPSPTSRTMSAPKMKKRGSIIADTKEKLASPQVRRALTARATRNGCAVLQY